jgi:hypothetical protein
MFVAEYSWSKRAPGMFAYITLTLIIIALQVPKPPVSRGAILSEYESEVKLERMAGGPTGDRADTVSFFPMGAILTAAHGARPTCALMKRCSVSHGRQDIKVRPRPARRS